MIELYHYPNSTCAQKVNLCLFEKELTVHRHHVESQRVPTPRARVSTPQSEWDGASAC